MGTSFNISFGLVDVTAKQDTTATATGIQYFTDPQDLALEGVYAPPAATFEKSYWKLDGGFVCFPDNPKDTSWGIWSDLMSGDDGLFTAKPVLTLMFDVNHSSLGLTFEFNPYGNNYCNDINIKWYSGNVVLSDMDFKPDFWRYSCLNKVENYNKVVVTFKSMNNPQRYLKVQNVMHGVTKEFGDKDILQADILEEIDLTSAQLSVNTMDFKVYSEDDDFNIFNPAGVYNLLQKKQQINVEGTIDGVSKGLGVFYVDEWKTEENKMIGISTTDGIGIMDGTYFNGGIYNDIAAKDLIEAIMNDAGFGYALDSGLSSIKLSGWVPRCTHREALQQAAFAVGAYVDTSRGGMIKIKALPDFDNSSSHLIGRNRKFTGTAVGLKSYVSGVSVTEHKYALGADVNELFNGEPEEGDNEILFSQPSSVTSVTGGILKESGVNRCVVTVAAAGKVIVKGKKYEDSTKIVTVKDENIIAGEKENILEISDATLISAGNSLKAAQRVYDYYNKRIEQSISFNLKDEVPGSVADIEVYEGIFRKGVIEKLDTDLAGGFITKAVVVGE